MGAPGYMQLMWSTTWLMWSVARHHLKKNKIWQGYFQILNRDYVME